MLTPTECGQAAEDIIVVYCHTCQCETPEEVRKAGEMLVSKMARAIEKYAGADQALAVLQRTALHVARVEGGVS